MKVRRVGLVVLVLLIGIFLVSVYLSTGKDLHNTVFPADGVETAVGNPSGGSHVHGSGKDESVGGIYDRTGNEITAVRVKITADVSGKDGSNGIAPVEHQGERVIRDKGKCQLVDIAIVCAGYNSTRTAMTLIKSLLFYRSSLLHLHMIVDAPAKLILSNLFDTWEISNLSVSYYLTDGIKEYVAWIPNKHYSGIYGLMKLVLPQILPDDLHQVIVLDTDIIFASDVAELWSLFGNFDSEQAIGLVENQSDWYLGGIWKNYKAWPAQGRGYNTGVILMDLGKLRRIQWMNKWKMVTERELPVMQSTALADQDIFNTVLKENPRLVYLLPCAWNAQLSDHSKSEELCVDSLTGFKIIHWNSPKKMQVKHRLGRYYKNDYLTFVAHDGNLLRRGVLGCASPTIQKGLEGRIVDGIPTVFDETCYDFERLIDLKFRTHLYFIEYSYEAKDSGDVTLVAQLSFDRLQMLEPLCNHWAGPMSLALYMTDAEAQQFADFITDSEILSVRRNVGYHVVYKDGVVYPVNYLRNVALSQAPSPFVFLTDIDFLPMLGLYRHLKDNIIPARLLEQQQPKALVIPAFETLRYRLTFPENKSQLVAMVHSGDVIAFRSDVWPKGHGTTNYSRWIDGGTTSPYSVEWEPDYEPYIVVNRNVPEYDRRFGGFGWNKVSHLMMLAVKGYELIVLPDVFIIHMPHSPSIDIAKFRTKSQYRRCLNRLKQEFVRDLAKIYGMKATKYLISKK